MSPESATSISASPFFTLLPLMKPTPTLLITAALLLLGSVLPLAAQVPQIINYQGRISSGGTPFSGTGQFKLALVNGPGNTTYWSNDGTSTAGSEPTAPVSLPVVNGLYLVPMGDATLPNMTAIPATVFSNADVRVRVWFNDGTTGTQQLSPDQRITSVGYAMMAGQAQTVPDGSITAAKLAPGAIDDPSKVSKSGDTMSGNLSMSGYRIANLGSPVSSGDAAPKSYVDTEVQGNFGNLSSTGTINQAGNPVDWTRLKSVPAGFADGADNVGVTSITAGNGLSGGTITGSGTISLSGDVPRLSSSLNNFTGTVSASNFIGDGSQLTQLSGVRLQTNSVPITALVSNARPQYDRQFKYVAGSVALTSTLADVTGLTLTTKNLGGGGTYKIEFQCTVGPNSAQNVAYLNVNGSDVAESVTELSGSSGFGRMGSAIVVSNVATGTIIKVRMRSSTSGNTLWYGQLIIDGVPSSQVTP